MITHLITAATQRGWRVEDGGRRLLLFWQGRRIACCLDARGLGGGSTTVGSPRSGDWERFGPALEAFNARYARLGISLQPYLCNGTKPNRLALQLKCLSDDPAAVAQQFAHFDDLVRGLDAALGAAEAATSARWIGTQATTPTGGQQP